MPRRSEKKQTQNDIDKMIRVELAAQLEETRGLCPIRSDSVVRCIISFFKELGIRRRDTSSGTTPAAPVLPCASSFRIYRTSSHRGTLLPAPPVGNPILPLPPEGGRRDLPTAAHLSRPQRGSNLFQGVQRSVQGGCNANATSNF